MTPSPVLPDPRPPFSAAVATAVTVVEAVRPDQVALPTPCPEYDVRALLGHVVSVLRRVAAVGRGAPASSVPQVTTDVPDAGWATAVQQAAADVAAVWADHAVLDRELTLPYGTHRGAVALATYTGEVTTHSWDLAVATGQQPDWDADAVAAGLLASTRLLTATGRGPGIPFAPAVAVPDGAPAIVRLVAWQGRNPDWAPPA